MPPASASPHNMVSLEEPRSLVQQLVTKFYPENDVAMIANIDRVHAKVIQTRQQELAASHEQLQVWIKKVEAAKWDAQRPADRSELRHAEKMSEAEKEKFQLVKIINDQELSIQQLETSIQNLKGQVRKLKDENCRLEQMEIDIYALQLQLLQGLKVSWGEGSDGLQCMVKSRAQNDIHVFKLSEYGNKMELVKKIWDAISNSP